jgi:type IV fimbrial biogenesis protein FimT
MIDRIRGARGHTLPELMAMLGVAAILAVAAIPVFSHLLLETRMTAAVATAMHAVNLARQFSATRGEAIHLCGSENEHECSGLTDWSAGLLLANDGERYTQSIAVAGGPGAPRIHSNREILSFEAGSGFATPATLTVCDRRGSRAARAVIVSRSGRPRASGRDASDRALAC